MKFIMVTAAELKISLAIVRRNGLGSEKIETHKLVALRKITEGKCLGMMTTQYRIDLGKITLRFGFGFVNRKRKTPDWPLSDRIRSRLRKVKMILNQRAIKI